MSDIFRYADDSSFDKQFENQPIETIDIEDIIPTQKTVNINNLKSTKNVDNNTGAYLLKHNGKYYVLDGHHRISNRILNGDKFIKGFVYQN
jgi:hypothetical protein